MALKIESGRAPSATSFDGGKRPKPITDKIDAIFQDLSRQTKSGWGLFNGDLNVDRQNDYLFCAAYKAKEMITQLIQEAPSDQKDFYILDVGAGEFGWGEVVANHLNKQSDLRKDIQIHILGVRGERFTGEPVIEKGRCKLYRMGAFKVEEIADQFRKHKLDVDNKIDFAISHWCLRHLVDPVGTFEQIYNLLRPQKGMALLDGFRYGIEKNDRAVYGSMVQLFLDTTAPFLASGFRAFNTLNHFLLRRPDDSPCRLPLEYTELKETNDPQVSSGVVTIFKRKKEEDAVFLREYEMMGDPDLHAWVQKHELLAQFGPKWVPLKAETDLVK